MDVLLEYFPSPGLISYFHSHLEISALGRKGLFPFGGTQRVLDVT